MTRMKLKSYQDTYAEAMAGYGLQRGIDGSVARHISTQEFYRNAIAGQKNLQDNIDELLRIEEQKRQAVERLKQQEIDRLHKSVEYYRQLNAITLPSLLRKRNSQGALHLTEDEWDIIQQNTDTCFDGFTTRLKEHCPQLTEEELRFCCLVKMDLPLSLLSLTHLRC